MTCTRYTLIDVHFIPFLGDFHSKDSKYFAITYLEISEMDGISSVSRPEVMVYFNGWISAGEHQETTFRSSNSVMSVTFRCWTVSFETLGCVPKIEVIRVITYPTLSKGPLTLLPSGTQTWRWETPHFKPIYIQFQMRKKTFKPIYHLVLTNIAMEAMTHRNRWCLPFLIAWWIFPMANFECHNQMVKPFKTSGKLT